MARVNEIVDYVIDEGMYCIVNIHHDTGTHGWLNADPAKYLEISRRFKAIWQQVAERFKGYDERLLFEASYWCGGWVFWIARLANGQNQKSWMPSLKDFLMQNGSNSINTCQNIW